VSRFARWCKQTTAGFPLRSPAFVLFGRTMRQKRERRSFVSADTVKIFLYWATLPI
jgi:hypothetical protein